MTLPNANCITHQRADYNPCWVLSCSLPVSQGGTSSHSSLPGRQAGEAGRVGGTRSWCSVLPSWQQNTGRGQGEVLQSQKFLWRLHLSVEIKGNCQPSRLSGLLLLLELHKCDFFFNLISNSWQSKNRFYSQKTPVQLKLNKSICDCITNSVQKCFAESGCL